VNQSDTAAQQTLKSCCEQVCRQTTEYQQIIHTVATGRVNLISGLPVLPKSLWTAAFFVDLNRPVLLLVANQEEAQQVYENLLPVLSDRAVYFPYLELMPFAVYGQNMEVIRQRIDVLSRLVRGEKLVVVAWIESVMRKLVPPQKFAEGHLALKVTNTWQMTDLSYRLSNMGYERETMVELPGTYSIRGSLIDVFPFNGQQPIRIEFFDDEIESIRLFDAQTQVSEAKVEAVTISPAREMPWDREAIENGIVLLEKEVAKSNAVLKGPNKKQLKETFSPLLEKVRQKFWDPAMEGFLTLFYPDACTLIDYMPGTLLVLDEPDSLKKVMADAEEARQSRYCDLLESGRLLPSFYDNFWDYEGLKQAVSKHFTYAFSLLGTLGDLAVNNHVKLSFRQVPVYAGNFSLLKEDFLYFRQQGFQIVLTASTPLRLERIKEILTDLDVPGVNIFVSGFTSGVICDSLKFVLITEKELFLQERKQKKRAAWDTSFKPEHVSKIEHFLDLKVGDYVVHNIHGIGQYMGVERLLVGDMQRDYLFIRYAGEDRLYVPVDQLDLVQKYIGDDAARPKLYKLGSSEWQKVKNKVKAAVRDMAAQLLKLYAKRQNAEGYAFSGDGVWQKEFEDVFAFEETYDQIRAIAEIKHDMEEPKPMDRLLCGDVGYGKTEVAIRAIFKAVMDGKQVAVLVPTTVLAQQHYETFRQRFCGYPVTIDCLSRFYSAKEQKETVQKLKDGRVDIVIGTHRLLSNDVNYHDLGLLIVDEEQRFGVAHKEKIKAIRENVDVLTLSATPIPRTLHMALVGMRDMSLIATPPKDRLPVQTFVLEYHDRLIRDVIQAEITRKGQVYFVHNRVKDLPLLALNLEKLVPEAKVAVAHGQMKERELETVMMDFIAGKINVLVCTTIIESGLDIPNANTLIVNEADCFGLAQLYQLRGRVGRWQRQAFAYFTYRKNRVISDVAKKRLSAIQSFTELGAGFKIAMRDMEIRGVGNILGAEQHGHIAAVGFDLYCRLLQEEISAQSGGEIREEPVSTLLELGLDAYLPNTYIEDSALKMEIYKRIAAMETEELLDQLSVELEDRYGRLLRPVRNLLLLGKVKVLARKLSLISITKKAGCFELKFAEHHPIHGEHLLLLSEEWPKTVRFAAKKGLEIKVQIGQTKDKVNDTPVEHVVLLLDILRFLVQVSQKEEHLE